MNGVPKTFDTLKKTFEGELLTDDLSRAIYATDASVYQEIPTGVAIPKTDADIQRLILFAREHNLGLIPRTAGTSLSGQVVGSGIVVDVSRHFTGILEINAAERWVRVQPGVIRNELNHALAKHGLLFGPETSTQNRAMMGGMVGNNSCGSNSIVYGSTRDHTLELTGYLSDGTRATFRALSAAEFQEKCQGPAESLESHLYRETLAWLSDPETRAEIAREFPKPEIARRNTGYAVDLLMDAEALAPAGAANDKPFNFCKLLAGSEGTLFFTTEIVLNCLPFPPAISGVLCAHFETVDQALRATLLSVRHGPYACELIDHFVLDTAKTNLEQSANLGFLQGAPGAILVTALRAESEPALRAASDRLVGEYRDARLGYAFPLLLGEDEKKIWDLRKAGLGMLNTMPGDAKPVTVIEDAAVAVSDLPAYIRDADAVLTETYNVRGVHYAHAGAGEIHLRPILDLTTERGRADFRSIAMDIAKLVKKYRGSLSGEHGDGRLRGEFLRFMIGDKNYALLTQVKQLWDPYNVFNPNKIVDAPPMHQALRYSSRQRAAEYNTVFDFSESRGVLRAAELCGGSGDCRKTHLAGGTMCPSYMATRNEKDTTRARANMLRQVLTSPRDAGHPFDSEELKEVMDLCLSCKGCKRECPSGVDVAKLKAEFLQGYYDVHGIPRRARMIADFSRTMGLAAGAPWFYNFLVQFPPTAQIIKRLLGFASARSLPILHRVTLRQWFRSRRRHGNAGRHGSVLFFCDEFTNFHDAKIGMAAIDLLEQLGYAVELPKHQESGRAALSKGLLRKARGIAESNLLALAEQVTDTTPLIGVEPSAILSFRDEYPELVRAEFRDRARHLAKHSLLVDEFLAAEIHGGRITSDAFGDSAQEISLHGHCHQKAVASLAPTIEILSLPANYVVRPIHGEGYQATGCCGMAGSFGYEREHYALSRQIAELVLLPAVRQLGSDVVIAATGTSCRHQILDLSGREVFHPVELLRDALK